MFGYAHYLKLLQCSAINTRAARELYLCQHFFIILELNPVK